MLNKISKCDQENKNKKNSIKVIIIDFVDCKLRHVHYTWLK